MGALYTGRGPVCGMMVRGAGATGRIGALAAGRTPTDVAAMGGGVAAGGATGGRAGVPRATLEGPGWGALGAGGAVMAGLTAGAGPATGEGTDDGAGGAATFGAETGATGWVTAVAAGAEGRTEGGAAGACCLRIAFRTSPGREIFDRSILVLISSASTRLERDGFAEPAASPAFARKCARTLTAS